MIKSIECQLNGTNKMLEKEVEPREVFIRRHNNGKYYSCCDAICYRVFAVTKAMVGTSNISGSLWSPAYS